LKKAGFQPRRKGKCKPRSSTKSLKLQNFQTLLAVADNEKRSPINHSKSRSEKLPRAADPSSVKISLASSASSCANREGLAEVARTERDAT
jgi:hypothetical protein